MKKYLFALLLLILGCPNAWAQKSGYLGKELQILSLPDSISANEVAKMDFNPVSDIIPNLGVTNDIHWIKIDVPELDTFQNYYLYVDNPLLQDISLFILQEGKLKELNSLMAPMRGALHYKEIVIPVVPNLYNRTLVIKAKSTAQVLLPIKITPEKDLYVYMLGKKVYSAIYLGVVIVMLLYNLFLFFSVKDISYFYYVLFIATVGMAQLSLDGFAQQFLFPNNDFLQKNCVHLFGALSGLTTVLFAINFLRLKEYSRTYYYIFSGYIVYSVLVLVIYFLGNQTIAYSMINFSALSAVLLIFCTIHVVRLGYRPARFFLYSITAFVIALIIFVLRDFGILPYSTFTSQIVKIGSGIEIVLISLALADKINNLKRENDLSNKRALQVSQENERIVKEQNLLLERKVSERTAEQKKVNTELQAVLADLQSAQSQLVNSEKMASLGQLTAGIAHEINNPINFVTANVKPLRRDFEDIQEVLQAYAELHGSEAIKDKLQEISELKEDLELDYILEEVNNLLNGIEEGAARTASIVRGLKIFSRQDEMDIKLVDIEEGLNSTLTLLNNKIKDSIELERNFDQISPIECYGGKINQVFMNILGNAIFAINARENAQTQGKLIVNLTEENEMVTIEVIDNGIGMSEDVQRKIFEPFFTTKKVGEGTGLGMSISFSIIQQHNGTIDLESEVGKGTRFVIKLPREQKFSTERKKS